MSATAADVDRTLYAALLALMADPGPPTDSQPLASVVRITEPLTKLNVDGWTSQWPCAMLFWQQGLDDVDADTMAGTEFETRERARWIVYVGVADPRDGDATIIGATGVPGALTLKAMIAAACNGLMVPAPAATVQLNCHGIADETDAIDPDARVIFTVNGKDFVFAIAQRTVTWGSDGTAVLTGTCVAPAGALGNLGLGLPGGGGAWNALAPTHSFGVPISIRSVVTPGQYGTLRDKPVRLVDARPHREAIERGSRYVLAMTFEAELAEQQWTLPDESRPLGPINGNVNATDANNNSLTVDAFTANTQT